MSLKLVEDEPVAWYSYKLSLRICGVRGGIAFCGFLEGRDTEDYCRFALADGFVETFEY